ncbi:hypothetical protein Y1Q_0022531 [Alligator mississippiensis]|uniref:Uncharacterized protein n=1 Tax=Alligator mississippiensis TaxID=8496 RepID=A0A151NWS6_ALLMI|nr:hypothetical protein Y1Q_0022531 [Alligator mississippiensis]
MDSIRKVSASTELDELTEACLPRVYLMSSPVETLWKTATRSMKFHCISERRQPELNYIHNVTYGFRLQTLQTTDYIQWSDYP